MSVPEAIRFKGVYVAMATPFHEDGGVDLDSLAGHCVRLAGGGVHGLVPCGSLGEYEALSDEERAEVVKTAMDATPAGVEVVPGVSAKSGPQARRWAEHAGEAGCRAVMCLPPTAHAPSDDEVVAHFREVARAGLPIIAYNNPFSTRVDLTPALLARLGGIDEVVAVKEFSQDVRRVAAIRQAAPGLEILCGCDDTFVEAMLMGATGWIAGFANALPAESVELYDLCIAGRWEEAVAKYVPQLPLLRWDADPRFVQAIKLTMDELGQHGGPVRLPRLALSAEDADLVRSQLRTYLASR
ncbi:MAG TPA: dihydrodipicolinate synthase family protein [Acidimicrobiales bacterium]|nr:dihydrodipicolinate synthase family protein [Acidimicrobiales bacterium]